MKRSLLSAALAALALVAGCDTPLAKFAACESDTDCPPPDGGKLVCYNRRCVECHYDGDCSDGKLCGGNNTCESLDTRTPPEAEPPPPKSLEECAKRCKGDPVCGQSCRDRFPVAPAPR